MTKILSCGLRLLSKHRFIIQEQRIWKEKGLNLYEGHLRCDVQETHFATHTWTSDLNALTLLHCFFMTLKGTSGLFQSSRAFCLVFLLLS